MPPLLLLLLLIIFGEKTGFSNEIGVGSRIQGLRWKAGPISIVRELRIGTNQILVSGFFSRPGWKLYLRDYEIPLKKEDGEFVLAIPVNINHIKAEFFARNGKGDFEKEIVYISLNDFFSSQDHSYKNKRRSHHWFEKQLKDMSFNVGVGTTLLSYDQTSLPAVSETGFSPRTDLTYVFAQNEWSFECSAYLSFFSIVKLLGSDVRLGYEMPLVEGRVAFYLFGGLYYATTFGSDTLGYSDVWGPLFYPALRATFQNGSSLSVYGKYSPILSDYLPMGLENASGSVGVSYFFKPFRGPFLRGVPFGVTLEANRLKLGLEGGALSVMTYTLSGNLLF